MHIFYHMYDIKGNIPFQDVCDIPLVQTERKLYNRRNNAY